MHGSGVFAAVERARSSMPRLATMPVSLLNTRSNRPNAWMLKIIIWPGCFRAFSYALHNASSW